MKRDNSRPPIWFLMVVVLIAALYAAGIRVLMQPRTGEPEQAATKIWVGFWLCSMTAVLLTIARGLYRREERAEFFAIFRPDAEQSDRSMATVEKIYQSLGLEAGQRFRLPDGSVCVVRFCDDWMPRAILDYDPKRELEESGTFKSETIGIDHNHLIWRHVEEDSIVHGIEWKIATEWTLDDLRMIESPA